MTRREFLTISTGVSIAATTAIYSRQLMDNIMIKRGGIAVDGISSFFNRLKIPPEIKGVLKDGVRDYNFNIKQSSTEFIKGFKTPTYGINGSYLGPTIRLKRGERVSLNWHNKLKEATTIHGHGMHLPAVMDGGVHQVIEPNNNWSAKYKVNQKACTNWYHPHMMGATATQVLMGLGGMIFIDDEESLKMALPKRYGVDDIPLVIQDRLFTKDGYFAYPQNIMTTMHGFLGDTLLVNGTVAPFIEVEDGLLRLRLLNASNARVYNFTIEGVNMELIAGDNSFLERPMRVSSVVLSPAERAEVVVNLKNHFNKKLYLVDRESGSRVLEIRVNKKAKVKSRIPALLTKLEPIDLSKVKRKRKFVLQAKGPGRLVINNKSMDKNKIDERVKVNEWEIWEVENAPMGMGMMRMGMTHNFHMHASHFRVLKRDGSRAKVKPWERGYKDTVKLGLNEKVTLLVRHTDYTDSKHPYMFHCHILEHEDAGMMGQFTVEA